MSKAGRATCLLGLLVGGCARAAHEPVMPPVFDSSIVFGQRVGPVSLGMSEAQLVHALGPPTSDVIYASSRERRGLGYDKLGLGVVLDGGSVVRVSPMDRRYLTASGIRIGAPLPADAAARAAHHANNGIVVYCFDGGGEVIVRTTAAAAASPDCAVGEVCDIAVGECIN